MKEDGEREKRREERRDEALYSLGAKWMSPASSVPCRALTS